MRRPVRSLIRFSRHHSTKLKTWSSASEVSGASSASTRRAIGVFVPRRFCLGCLATSGFLNDRASHKKGKGPPRANAPQTDRKFFISGSEFFSPATHAQPFTSIPRMGK